VRIRRLADFEFSISQVFCQQRTGWGVNQLLLKVAFQGLTDKGKVVIAQILMDTEMQSVLSYIFGCRKITCFMIHETKCPVLGRQAAEQCFTLYTFEPVTSAMSTQCSNQLS
jgi:hypothetical protein